MSDLENQRARAEAVEQVPRALRSARRAQLWAGLNRYLASEAVHAHKVAKAEQDTERPNRATPPAQRKPAEEDSEA